MLQIAAHDFRPGLALVDCLRGPPRCRNSYVHRLQALPRGGRKGTRFSAECVTLCALSTAPSVAHVSDPCPNSALAAKGPHPISARLL